MSTMTVFLLSLMGPLLADSAIADSAIALGRTDFIAPDFIALCQQRQQRPADERHTLEQLLEIANTTDCATAAADLADQTALDLQNRQITTLTPLTYFPQVTTLYLDQNHLTDLSPLVQLSQLEALYLSHNQITDLGPVAQLTALHTLYLDNNHIQDLSPVRGLQNLSILYANNNRIRSGAALAALPNLTQLYLSHNQLGDLPVLQGTLTHLGLGHNRLVNILPLADQTRLVELSLNSNRLQTVADLSELPQLNRLDLRANPLSSKACPVFPATVCLFSDDAAELRQQAEQQRQNGDLQGAIATLKSALTVYQRNGDQLRASDTLDTIGQRYDDLGQYANSLQVYEQAATLRQAAGDRQGESETLTNLGIIHIRIGQTDKAVVLLERALAMQQQLTPRDRPQPQTGPVLSALALAYTRLGNTRPALRYAKRSLAHARYLNDTEAETLALNRVGEAYLQAGNMDKARLYLNQAFDLSQQEHTHPSLARSLHNLGDLAQVERDFDSALTYYQQAQQHWQTLQNPAAEGHTLNALGELYLSRNQLSEAVTTLQATVALWESLRPGLTDTNKISIAETQSRTYQLLQQALIAQNNPARALEISERGRARAFAELRAHRLSLQGKTLPPAQLQSPSFEQIQAIAHAQNTALIEYALLPDQLYIWVVTPEGQIHFRRRALSASDLSQQITDSRLTLGVRGRGFAANFGTAPPSQAQQQAQQQLYQWLIAPIAELLPPGVPLAIVPQAELFLVPFPALQNETGTDLIEQHPIRFAPALSLLSGSAGTERLGTGAETALVVGNPIMPNDPNTGMPLSPLTGAQQEALEIAPLLNADPLIGLAATKAAVVEQIQTATIAHFATHGLLDDFGTDVPGALALTPTESDPGFLTANEIFDLPLAARLVVLSACDTGRGKITGDGVVGLSRSFLTAGVDSVVVSLWSVPDDATALLMTEFYRRLQQQPNRAVALQQAMLATRERYPHPYYWAAFSLFGEAY
ncbi:MAG: CHAT domain-containing protein [Cyanobacteria bacterium J06632_22]